MQEYVSPNLSKGKIATRLRFVKSLMNEPQYFWNNLEAKWRSLPYCKEPHLKKSIYSIPEQTPHANCKHGSGGVIIWDLWPQNLGILHCCA